MCLQSVGGSTDVGRTRTSLIPFADSTVFDTALDPDRHEHPKLAIPDRRRTDVRPHHDPNTTDRSIHGHGACPADVLSPLDGPPPEPHRRVERRVRRLGRSKRLTGLLLPPQYGRRSKPSFEYRPYPWLADDDGPDRSRTRHPAVRSPMSTEAIDSRAPSSPTARGGAPRVRGIDRRLALARARPRR